MALVSSPTRTTCAVSAGQAKAEPDYDELHAGLLANLIGELLRFQTAPARRGHGRGAARGAGLRRAYTRAKRAAGVADFDDLIRWTRRLLDQAGMGDWVRYKLDQRTDHILVDEAQDTNADQWEIVDPRWPRNISAGRAKPRAGEPLFMVGDFKQAIFGFQGTDPARVRRDARRKGRRKPSSLKRGRARRRCSRARIPRPVDRRQLPLGAGGPRSGRRA